jgi:hypothetical protein
MLPSRDGETTPSLNNGTLIKLPRLSRTTTGRVTPSTFNPMEVQPTSDVPPLTQDGGRSSKLKVDTLSMRRARFLKFKTKT